MAFLAFINHLVLIKNPFYIANSNSHMKFDESEHPLLTSLPDDEEKLSRSDIMKICAPDIYSVFVTLMGKLTFWRRSKNY